MWLIGGSLACSKHYLVYVVGTIVNCKRPKQNYILRWCTAHPQRRLNVKRFLMRLGSIPRRRAKNLNMETLKSLEHTVNRNTLGLFKGRLTSLVESGLSSDAIIPRLWVSFRCFRIRDLERIVNEAIADREKQLL